MALKLTNIKCEIREVRLNNKPKAYVGSISKRNSTSAHIK